MLNLPLEFLNRMKQTLGKGYADFLNSYNRPPEKAIRVNTLKISADEFKKISPFSLEQVEWEDNGFYVSCEKPGKFVEHSAGLYYVQEPSAMSAVPHLGKVGGERILDLCSAPGGKGTQIAQNMQGEGIIFLNEINFSRAKILSSNVERMGIKNAVVTCASPEQLANEYAGYFTKILVDAPCSGEGMFKKEEAAIPNWSMQNVSLCAERQKQILNSVHRLLAPNSELVYSTCTFAEEEDELQIENFLNEHPEYTLLYSKKLYPHEVRGEGHYVAHLKKNGTVNDGETNTQKPLTAQIKDKKLLSSYKDFESQTLNVAFDNLYLSGNNLYSLPQNCPQLKVQTLRAGVHLGEFEKGRFVPSHSLAMCLNNNQANFFNVTSEQAESYFKGLTLPCPEEYSSWKVIAYKGYPLGWCKCVTGTAKNHFPKGLRIN